MFFSAAFLLLASSHLFCFLVGVMMMGVAHAVITTKGTHLASHGALSESQVWGKFWAVFFIEVRQRSKIFVNKRPWGQKPDQQTCLRTQKSRNHHRLLSS